MAKRYTAESALKPLKDFQINTVDYVFDKLYISNETDRFLVADEVGLGKTLIARGVIAKAIEYNQDKIDRFDVVYICSNAAIARQNMRKLNVLDNDDIAQLDRLTMLPQKINELLKHNGEYQSNINFISFSPNTSFNLVSSMGRWEERVLIYHMLKGLPEVKGSGFKNFLQRGVETKNWNNCISHTRKPEYDNSLAEDFKNLIVNNDELRKEIEVVCELFHWRRKRWPWELSRKANKLIGKLRNELAKVCVNSLEPDLIILDEFQRFKNILSGEDEASILARAMFEHNNADGNVKLLLLSATPYKMMTLNTEDEEHYSDFIKTLSFLFKNDEKKLNEVKVDLRNYKNALSYPDDFDLSITQRLQKKLLSVMTRTERVNITKNHNSMLNEYKEFTNVVSKDILHADYFQKISRIVQSHNIVEYWKSSPYLLNYLKGYQIRRKIDQLAEENPAALMEIINSADDQIIYKEKIENYSEVDFTNPRLRYLKKVTIDNDMWKLLWIPPSIPYYRPEGVYKDKDKLTKKLIFSSWNAVPDAISTLLSYEVERRMILSFEESGTYSDLSKSSTLLEFRMDKERVATMPILMWMMPWKWLAEEFDPLAIALENENELTQSELIDVVRAKIELKLNVMENINEEGIEDFKWYWMAMAYFEDDSTLTHLVSWKKSQEKISEGLNKHIDFFIENVKNEPELGKRPANLSEILAYISVAGPGTCAYRALKRNVENINDEKAFSLAMDIGEGFRTLFNKPENSILIRGMITEGDYWQKVLKYSTDGNIQALLDEQFHMTSENIKSKFNTDEDQISKVFQILIEGLTIKTSRVQLDGLKAQDGDIVNDKFNIRCHYALRFGEFRGDDALLVRIQDVQSAFNSPFRPFVLACTSIGQEGLDFHPWCHDVVHWNLPSNPVDLEQREGRVQRYKGHAIRKNISQSLGLKHLKSSGYKEGDLWQWLFEELSKDKRSLNSDLVPFWIYEEGDTRINRIVPILPYSMEIGKYNQLKDMLTIYRLAFGQPRQEDLLKFLSNEFSSTQKEKLQDMQLILMP